MEGDEYLNYWYDKKQSTFEKYTDIENEKIDYDIQTKSYKNHKNKINKYSNKLSNINNSIFYYEQFLIKNSKKNQKREEDLLIQKLIKIIFILNFSNFDSKIDEKFKEEELDLRELFYSIENFPNNKNEFQRIYKYSIICLKLLINKGKNENKDSYINYKFNELKLLYEEHKNINDNPKKITDNYNQTNRNNNDRKDFKNKNKNKIVYIKKG